MLVRRTIAIAALAAALALPAAAMAAQPPFHQGRPAQSHDVQAVVWIPGHWERHDGRRIYVRGHEELAPRHDDRVRQTWIPGHWDDHRPGHRVWVEGHWS